MPHEIIPPDIRHANRMQHVAAIYQEANRYFSVCFDTFTALPPTNDIEFVRALETTLATYHFERTAALLSTLVRVAEQHPQHWLVSLEWNDTLEEENETYTTIHDIAMSMMSQEQFLMLRQGAIDSGIQMMADRIIGRQALARPPQELTKMVGKERRNSNRYTVTGREDMDLIYDYTSPKESHEQDVRVSIGLRKIV